MSLLRGATGDLVFSLFVFFLTLTSYFPFEPSSGSAPFPFRIRFWIPWHSFPKPKCHVNKKIRKCFLLNPYTDPCLSWYCNINRVIKVKAAFKGLFASNGYLQGNRFAVFAYKCLPLKLTSDRPLSFKAALSNVAISLPLLFFFHCDVSAPSCNARSILKHKLKRKKARKNNQKGHKA